MGAGNLTYRREIWSNKKGAFLTPASCLRLAVLPLFTQSDRSRKEKPKIGITNVVFTPTGRTLKISGEVRSKLEVLAVIAYDDPPGKSDYNAISLVCEVKDKRFHSHPTVIP